MPEEVPAFLWLKLLTTQPILSGRVKHALLPHPALPRASVFRALLLRRVQAFF
jgi:hypothetical protein